MCGIAGIVSLDQQSIEPTAIKRMCDTIAHRGPNDAGYVYFQRGERGTREGGYWSEFADPEFRHTNEHLPIYGGDYWRQEVANSTTSVALGHRRLAIIDLSHYGHQPMAGSDRRYWVTYNGEIYNFPQLRSQLESDGHRFRTRNDTEVLLHLWEQHGSEALLMLDGMFTFAIYDRVTDRLTLARDRFGVKPLYYAITGEHLIFASEIKAILASGLIEPKIDRNGLTQYFAFQNTFGSQTLFEGIHILPPGELLEYDGAQRSEPKRRAFHHGFPQVDSTLTDDRAAAEQVAETFRQAVERQLVSDVEIGSYLSGGMDSGSIVAIAGRLLPRLATFTAGFDLTNVNGIEQGFDERKNAEQLSYLLQTEHYDVVLHAGDMPAAMERITWHMDDPRVGMCHQNWYASKLASKFVRVCLAGAGGDELFGGYPWRYRQGLGAPHVDAFDQSYYRYWHRLLSPEELPNLFAGRPGGGPDRVAYDCALATTTREAFDGVMASAPEPQKDLSRVDNLLQRALHFEFKTFMHGYLVTEDHISMAHSLETRVPFLDNALADLAWSLPASQKINTDSLALHDPGAHLESTDGKRVLRRAMERFLPEQFTRQPKQGFSPPDENWFRGPSMEYIKDILLDKKTEDRPWFYQPFVREKLDEHFTGRRNHRLLIWSLMSFEWLQRHFIDNDCTR